MALINITLHQITTVQYLRFTSLTLWLWHVWPDHAV